MSAGFRRRYDDDHSEVEAKRPRGGPADHYETENKLRDLIARVGCKSGESSLESNMEGLVGLLESDLDRYREKVVEIIATCVSYLPEKISVYSTLVGLLNAKNFNFGGEIVERLVSNLQTALEDGKYKESLFIILFLCDLGNSKVLTIGSVSDFLENLLQVAFEDDIPQARADWFLFAVLHSLPWIGEQLAENKPDELKNMLDGAERYIEQRKKPYLNMLRVWTKVSPHEQEDSVDCLWKQINRLKDVKWKEKQIQRHYHAFDSVLQDALHHNLPNFSPPTHKEESVYPLPQVVFRLFDYADCSDKGDVMPGAHSIERFIIEQELEWILQQYAFNRTVCAEELFSYAEDATVPIYHMMLEVIFGQMFRLPMNPQPCVFYGSVLIELCRRVPEEIPPVLAQATELIYQRLEGMQPICIDRFVDWFSFHLSNFRYRWEWTEWSDCVDKKGQWNGKHIFVREVLEKIMRFSYHDRLRNVVPEQFSELVPVKPEIQFVLDNEAEPGFEIAKNMKTLFQERASNDILKAELKNEDGEYDPQTFAVFFAVILKMASQSFSHNFAALTKYFPTLKEVADVSEDMQEVLLRTLYGCWKNNSQMIVILVDKLLKMQVLDCGVVVAWIFSEDMKVERDRQWLWEVLNTALERLSKHIAKVDRDLETMKKNLAKKRNADDGEMEVEDATNKDDDAELAGQQEKLDSLRDFQKNLFLDVFHKFSVELTEHVFNSESEGTNFRTPWYEWFTGRFKQVFLMHNTELRRFTADMGRELFSETNVDVNVLESYIEFKSLTE